MAAILLIGGGAAAFFALSDKDTPTKGPGTRSANAGDPDTRRAPKPTKEPSTPAPGPGPEQPPVRPLVQPPDQPPDQPPAADPAPDPVPVKPPVDPVQPPPASDPASAQPADPTTPPVAIPAPDVPTPPPSGVSPEDCCEQAVPLFASGDWSGARAFYKQAVESSAATSPTQVAALRGAAESYIAEADALARSARVPEALALLGEAVEWLRKRHEVYEQVKNAVEVARLQLGFSRMHRAEAHAESGRC